jgi:hypothetical protein
MYSICSTLQVGLCVLHHASLRQASQCHLKAMGSPSGTEQRQNHSDSSSIWVTVTDAVVQPASVREITSVRPATSSSSAQSGVDSTHCAFPQPIWELLV